MLEVFRFEDMVCAKGKREMPWKPTFQMNVYYYLIDGLLIDSGPYTLAEEAIQFFNAHRINQVFLSHIHEDHSGMAYWLQEQMQVPIYIHEGSVEEAGQEPDLAGYRLDIWGRRRAFKPRPIGDTIRTSRYVFDVIDTPGHYPYHKVLHEKNRGWLFSGDLLNNLRPKSVMLGEDMSATILSLKKVLGLNITTIFCAHSGIRRNAEVVLQYKLSYLLDLQYNIRELRNSGMSNNEITQQLFPGPDPLGDTSGGEFSPYYLVSTL